MMTKVKGIKRAKSKTAKDFPWKTDISGYLQTIRKMRPNVINLSHSVFNLSCRALHNNCVYKTSILGWGGVGKLSLYL